jgi:hypothetical protein
LEVSNVQLSLLEKHARSVAGFFMRLRADNVRGKSATQKDRRNDNSAWQFLPGQKVFVFSHLDLLICSASFSFAVIFAYV